MRKDMKEKKIEKLLKKLTLEEKIGMIHGDGLFRTKGVERLGIPPLHMSDGPMGVRNEFPDASWVPVGNTDDFVTYLPSNSAIASTWNREIAKESGRVLGAEARGRGKDVILAPGVNIKRSPLCGRNFEYFSEDPYLTGELAAPLIQGIQEWDVAACVKHFALNNQETERLWVETEVSETALRELYLPAFEKAVTEGGSWTIMGAYNRFQGEHCCESTLLLNQILREEWEYDGVVISDWGAVHDTKKAALSGLDVEMSVTFDFEQYFMAEPLKKAVENGEIPEEAVDEKVRNLLRLMDRLHMLGEEEQAKRKAGCYNAPEHRQAVLEAARESIILLKNEEVLPFVVKSGQKILMVGDNAARIHSNGGGSAEIKALYEMTPLMGVKKLLGGNAQVDYVPGYATYDLEKEDSEVNWQADSLENGGGVTGTGEKAAGGKKAEKALAARQKALRKEAVKKAAQYDQVIFVGGLNHQQDLEGHDKETMELPYGQDQLIGELLKANPNTVVVLLAGAPVEMGKWLDQAKALVWMGYSGMEGGTALGEILFGKVNPSGHLAETIPFSLKDCPAHCIGEFPGDLKKKRVNYREGLFVGYRYFDSAEVLAAFPFGYGLSYTNFVWEEVSLKKGKNHPKEDAGEDTVKIKVTVENTGTMAGKEVVQVYVGPAMEEDAQRKLREMLSDAVSGKEISAEARPLKELKGFEKVELEPGEKKTVKVKLGKEAFAQYDAGKKEFGVKPGKYRIYVGRSVEDICWSGEIEM